MICRKLELRCRMCWWFPRKTPTCRIKPRSIDPFQGLARGLLTLGGVWPCYSNTSTRVIGRLPFYHQSSTICLDPLNHSKQLHSSSSHHVCSNISPRWYIFRHHQGLLHRRASRRDQRQCHQHEQILGGSRVSGNAIWYRIPLHPIR